MDASTRLEAHAIIDCLVADGQTFSREKARRLIELVPITRHRRLSYIGAFKSRGSSFRAHAASVGDVNLQGEPYEKKVTLNVPPSHKIGGYVVTHTPGHIAIELMWSNTQSDHTGQACAMTYDARTREPEAMSIAVQKTLTVLFIRLAYVSFVPWKTLDSSRM
ncbi:hypothetical protein [Microvirga guangxiensis]|uniref:Uncharacterized protein n=1 Tax=Microvirga guangxiensis TaxID=549386 RepID=A0A1G5KK30_9HYPH|nr:hypothetical protein [Microvirga guangxiensis]SCZ00724.1 hypothetical protein SAMN02927923_03377 [Microvirga guangxiensis]